MRLWSVSVLRISALRSLLKSADPSSASANCASSSATIVLSTTFGPEMENAEPSMRNSNLLPVNANGDVRLRSVVSFGKRGRMCTPTFMTSVSRGLYGVSCSIASRIPVSSSPKNIETMAGGASFAPRRWSFPRAGNGYAQ